MGTYAKFKRAILKGILAGFLLSLVAGPILTTFIPLVLAQQHDFVIEAEDDPEGISVFWDSNPANMRGFWVFRGDRRPGEHNLTPVRPLGPGIHWTHCHKFPGPQHRFGRYLLVPDTTPGWRGTG